jgi:thioredoxin 1
VFQNLEKEKKIKNKTMNSKIKMAILIAGIMFSSCTNATNKNATTNEQSNKSKIEKKMTATQLNKEEFLKKVYNYEANPKAWKFEGDKPCIVDFFATWCGPCKALSPVLEELAEEYAGKVDFYKVDVDKAEDLAGAFGIRSIPTLLFIPLKGQPQITQGALPKQQLKEIIEKELLK